MRVAEELKSAVGGDEHGIVSKDGRHEHAVTDERSGLDSRGDDRIASADSRVETLGRAVREAGTLHALQSEPSDLEVPPPGVPKGTAARKLLGVLDVALDDVIAVGDTWNDLEMIGAAGPGVAMGHAPEGVHARADHVCGTADHEGMREVVERCVLGRSHVTSQAGDGPK